MKIRQRPIRKARIEIIPMIDVIFFLLVFFMMSSLSMTKTNAIPVALPQTHAGPTEIPQKVILVIQKEGSIFINKTPVSLDTLGRVLADEMNQSKQEVLVVNADERTDYGIVLKAMGKAREVGVVRFALSSKVK